MNIYFLPMLLSGILCSVLSVVTWLYRRRESINHIFSLFTMILAMDSFAFFAWYQFGSVEQIHVWAPITFTAGFLVPIGLVFFFFAFTGYDNRLDEKVLGIKTRHFQIAAVFFILVCILLSQFTDWVQRIPDSPTEVWDIEMGPVGVLLFPLFALVFFYLFAMAFKAARLTDSIPQKRFIAFITAGTFIWLLLGNVGAAIFSASSVTWQAYSYIGTAFMAVFYFIAILNYQFDKVSELNLNLEHKVEERTRHLEETRAQLVQSEKMAALGHMVAGVAHEMNSPVGAVYSTHGTLMSAITKLSQTLEDENGVKVSDSAKLTNIMNSIKGVSDVIRGSGERITGIVNRLKIFARLDEADLQVVDFNQCIKNSLAIFEFHLKPNVVVRTEFADLPAVKCFPAKINQLCFQLLANANMAIEKEGEIILRTEKVGEETHFSVSDSGRGIPEEDVEKIFNPGYTAWDLKVGAGLGLAICYRVAQDHNGSIRVESEVGKGSTFIFSFNTE